MPNDYIRGKIIRERGYKMNVEVRYLSKSGNTKKIAEVIAKEVGCEALSIEEPITTQTDILFLGAAVYWVGVDSKMKEFILTLDDKVKKVVVFSTASIIPSAYPQMKKLLQESNISVDEREFHCRGKFSLLHTSRPNMDDLEDARLLVNAIMLNSEC